MIHAIERAKERYGLELTKADLAQIGKAIVKGKSVLLGRLECGTERHLVSWKNTALKTVFNPTHRLIITFEPKHTSKPANHWDRKRVAIRKRKARRKATRPTHTDRV